MNRYISLALLLGAAALGACTKNGMQDLTAPATGAYVKFFNFGVGAPGVNFYANTQKVTAISSTACQGSTDTTCLGSGKESTTGTGYGAAGNGALYNEVTPGTATLAGEIAATTDKGLPIATASATLENGKFYSYYVSGIYDAGAKKADAFVVEDPVPANLDYTKTYVRFVNAISNSQPMILYAKNQTTGVEVPIGSTVAYKSAGTFTPIDGAVYDLSGRSAGSSTNLITRTSVSFTIGHVYTITSRGDMTSSVTANKPAFDNTANR